MDRFGMDAVVNIRLRPPSVPRGAIRRPPLRFLPRASLTLLLPFSCFSLCSSALPPPRPSFQYDLLVLEPTPPVESPTPAPTAQAGSSRVLEIAPRILPPTSSPAGFCDCASNVDEGQQHRRSSRSTLAHGVNRRQATHQRPGSRLRPGDVSVVHAE